MTDIWAKIQRWDWGRTADSWGKIMMETINSCKHQKSEGDKELVGSRSVRNDKSSTVCQLHLIKNKKSNIARA